MYRYNIWDKYTKVKKNLKHASFIKCVAQMFINLTLNALKIFMKTTLKTGWILLMMFSFSCVAFAQKKPFQIETGLNYPIGLKKDSNSENRIGLYLSGTYNFFNSPLSAKLKLSYESYSVAMEEYTNSPFNGRSFVVLPSINYNFPISSHMDSYIGAGVGVTVDNMNRGVFNDGKKCYALLSPQLGVILLRHFNISAQYIITRKDFSRLMISVGYIF